MAIVAVVGRPNVGKSTLVNRIVGKREAIVEKTPGVTRDRKYLSAEWAGHQFRLIDTGGLDFEKKVDLTKKVRDQAIFAIREADVVVFLVDGASGLLPTDEEVAELLRKSEKPTLLTINKLDDPARLIERASFYKLGLGEPLEISALHGIGIGDFLDSLVALLPEEKKREERKEALSIAIIGRPNVGKSSLFNWLLGEERAIISELPGTTRDSIDSLVEWEGKNYLFVDTAGLRKKAKISTAVEYYSSLRVLQAIEQANLVLLVIDAQEDVADQDQKIASEIEKKGRACIILLNKWDLVKREEVEKILLQAQEALHFIDFAPTLTVSALTGSGVNRIFPTIRKVEEQYFRRVSTSKLNDFIKENRSALEISIRGKPLKIYYATQAAVAPPTFVFFVGRGVSSRLIPFNHRRFIRKRIRQSFDFPATPVRIRFREKRSDYSH